MENGSAGPSDEDIAEEWHRRATRQGLARVMRASQPAVLNTGVTERTRQLLAEYLRLAAQQLGRPLESALEVGCGIGRLTPTIAAAAARVTAIDMTPAMLAEARKRCARFANIDFVQARAEDLPWGQCRFDVSVSVWVLMHLLDEAALTKVCRSLAESSTFLVLFEYEQAHIPVSRWSRLRTLEDYLRLLPGGEVVRREKLCYGGDVSHAALIQLSR